MFFGGILCLFYGLENLGFKFSFKITLRVSGKGWELRFKAVVLRFVLFRRVVFSD